jgi:hypothetical protein
VANKLRTVDDGVRPLANALENGLAGAANGLARELWTGRRREPASGQRPWPMGPGQWPTARTNELRTVDDGVRPVANALANGLDLGPSSCRPAVIDPAGWSCCRPDTPSDWSRRYWTGGRVPIAGHASFGSAGVAPVSSAGRCQERRPLRDDPLGIAATTGFAPSSLEPLVRYARQAAGKYGG